MADRGSLVCSIHLDQPAQGRCRQCGKPFCGPCRVEDVASEESFCSGECRDAWRGRQARPAASNQELLHASATSIRSGWKLWIRSLPAVSLHCVPLAIVMSAFAGLPAWESIDAGGEPTYSALGLAVWAALASLGVAMTQAVMTEKHTGLVRGNPYLWAVKRFVPWLAGLSLVIAATIAGYILLILPGIYVALRLFWADEFTLIHGSGPMRGLKESWELTRESAGSIFVFQFLAGLAAYVILLPFLLVFALLIPHVADERILLFLIFWALFTIYAGLHAPEVVYFYGMRARQAMTLGESTKTLGI